MKRLFIFILLIVLSVGTASAESFVFAKNSNIDYWFRCFDANGNYCTSTTPLVINVQDPSGANALNNVSMTWNPTYYNVTLPTNYTGIYSAIISSPNQNLTSTFTYRVTPNGELPTTGQAFFYISLLTLLVFFFCIIFWAHMQDQSHLARFWWFAFMWIPIWAILFVGWNMADSFLSSQGAISAVLYVCWLVIGVAYPFFLLGLVLYTFYWIYKQKQIQDLINRGFTAEDAQSRVNGRGRGIQQW